MPPRFASQRPPGVSLFVSLCFPASWWRAGCASGWLLAGLALTPRDLVAQERPIAWSFARPPAAMVQGTIQTVQVRALIPPGWHLYSTGQGPGGPVPTAMTTPAAGGFAIAGIVRAPEPDIAEDPNFGILTETYADSVLFRVPITATATGAQTFVLTIAFQTCTDRYCLPPTAETLTASVAVRPAAPGAMMATAVPPAPPPVVPVLPPAMMANTDLPTAPARVQAAPATTQSLPLFLWLAAVMGALSLLTPCVFPMIPITVSYFTRTGERAHGSAAGNALVYALGIMATFTILGMAIAMLVGAGGINRFAANPWMNLLVTSLFLAFALNLFGVWQVSLPSGLLTRLHAASTGSRGGETAGILAMGLTFTLTSFTCTAPFVGTLLVMAAQGSWQWPLLGLLVFSGVFALPFFLLALMPHALARLPRSGSWLHHVKVMMGFVEVAAAMKFLANADMVLQWGVFTRDVVLGVWVVVAMAAAAYLAGAFGRSSPRPQVPRLQWAVAAGCLLMAAYLGRGLGGARLGELESFLPPPEGAILTGTATVEGELSWLVNDYPGALAQARREGKEVLVDFTGYTCTNCRWMEANMFPHPDVSQAMERFVRVRLYTDGQGALFRQHQQLELDLFGTVALPYYAILDSLGTPQSEFLGMTRKREEFLAFLHKDTPVALQ